MLNSYSSAGDLDEAKAVLDEMTESGISLNVVTYNIALNSRARVGDVSIKNLFYNEHES